MVKFNLYLTKKGFFFLIFLNVNKPFAISTTVNAIFFFPCEDDKSGLIIYHFLSIFSCKSLKSTMMSLFFIEELYTNQVNFYFFQQNHSSY